MQRTFAGLAAALATLAGAQTPEASDWGYYGGDVYGQRYSEIAQITRENVGQLEVAWTYRTGELGEGFRRADKLAFEATPVLAFGSLYLSTPTNIVIALDPATGRERWRHDPKIDRSFNYSEATSRGVTVWSDPDPKRSGPCARRVYTGTLDARLLALDADTGKPCADFGRDGTVDLTPGIRLVERGDYLVTSPPAVHRSTVIVGSAIGDNRAVEVERGTVRGFDARSGALRWSFDPIPDGEAHPAAGDWQPEEARATGAANAWSILTVDPASGIVYVPTGSASPDFWGGRRRGDNRFANTLLALEAETGKLVWHRQLVRHDLWDYDLAAQPALVELEREGAVIQAVLQATKMGLVFGFDRATGEPAIPMRERTVPRSAVPGEHSAPRQLFPTTPPLTSLAPVRPEDAWGLTFWDRGRCRKRIAELRNEGIYTPPDLRGTLLSPGYAGGVSWGGIAFDPERERIFAAVNHVPMVVTLMPLETARAQAKSDDYPHSEFAFQRGAPYAMRREPLLSPWGTPCTRPPWGTLVSLDLKTNRILWQVPLGSTEGITPSWLPQRDFGLPHAGGPIATAGELVFVGAAMDGYFRAFDLETGRELWKHKLPAGGQATPMTYRAGPEGRQFVVIAAGGHGGLGTARGDHVVAFALPKASRDAPKR